MGSHVTKSIFSNSAQRYYETVVSIFELPYTTIHLMASSKRNSVFCLPLNSKVPLNKLNYHLKLHSAEAF